MSKKKCGFVRKDNFGPVPVSILEAPSYPSALVPLREEWFLDGKGPLDSGGSECPSNGT